MLLFESSMYKTYDVKLYFKSVSELFSEQHRSCLGFVPVEFIIECDQVTVSRFRCEELNFDLLVLKYGSV